MASWSHLIHIQRVPPIVSIFCSFLSVHVLNHLWIHLSLRTTPPFQSRVGPRAGISMAAQQPVARRLLLRGQRLENSKHMKAFALDAIGLHLLGEYPYKNTDDLVAALNEADPATTASSRSSGSRPSASSSRRSAPTCCSRRPSAACPWESTTSWCARTWSSS
jgi:hypothetical protein